MIVTSGGKEAQTLSCNFKVINATFFAHPVCPYIFSWQSFFLCSGYCLGHGKCSTYYLLNKANNEWLNEKFLKKRKERIEWQILGNKSKIMLGGDKPECLDLKSSSVHC